MGMKIVAGFVMFVLMGVVLNAQEPRVGTTTVTSDAKVVAEITASSGKLVKNAPFSAEAVSESVQTLADGNRIVRSSSSKLYRNSEGRFRREVTGGTGGVLGSLYTYGPGVTLLDPVAGFRYMIDPNERTTRQFLYRPHNEIRVVTGAARRPLEGAITAARVRGEVRAADGQGVVVMSDKMKEEIKVAVGAAPVVEVQTGSPVVNVSPVVAPEPLAGVGVYSFGTAQNSKWETRSEELGVQNIEGVDADGSRTITTIPAGAIGNERPIEIVYEKWYSKELQLVVMSKHSDPRFGEQTYRLTNIVRNEPDPSLFSLPTGYKLITEPPHGTYTMSATKAVLAEKAAQAARSGQAPAVATSVSKTKP